MFCAISNVERRNNIDFVAAVGVSENVVILDDGGSGWGSAQFKDGKPADAALRKTCFPCHEPVKARDSVFTQYAP